MCIFYKFIADIWYDPKTNLFTALLATTHVVSFSLNVVHVSTLKLPEMSLSLKLQFSQA